jgi:hypothetical protein
MKAIKILVAVMGLLLIAGLGLLGYGLTSKTGKSGRAAAPPASVQFDAVSVPLPAGARTEQMMVVADRIVLRMVGGGPDRLVVLDPAAGTVVGSFVLTPEAPAAR